MLQLDPNWYHVDIWLIVVIAIIIISFLVLIISRGIRAHHRQASTGREELVGKIAEVKIALEPRGVVSIEGERWTAISETGWMKPGEEVIITKVDGLRLYVTKKE